MCKRMICFTLLAACAIGAQTAEETLRFAESLYTSGEARFAMLEFKRFVFQHPDHEEVPGAFRRLAELYITQNDDINGAQRILSALIERYPDSEESGKARTFLDFIEVNSDFAGEPLKRWMAAENLEKRQRYDLAVEKLESLISEYPNARLADDAWLRKGILLRDQLDKPEAARQQLSELKSRYPKSDLAGRAEFEAATTLATMEGREAEAATALRNFASAHPDHELANRAKSQAEALDKQTLKVERQFDTSFVKSYTVEQSRPGDQRIEIAIEVPVGLSQREVKATLEDALIKEGSKRSSPRDRVIVNAYFNYPLSAAGEARWTPGEDPVYDIEEQETKDVIRDVFIDILRKR